MLIKEIAPIEDFGTNLLKKENSDEIIDKIIELPLRKACRIFKQKGIRTVMSSANKNNLVKPEEKRTEKEDVKGKALFLNPATLKSLVNFRDAGRGYAWVMLDFDSLSNENKDLLFDLEERKDSQGNPIGEKGIWFLYGDYYSEFIGRQNENDKTLKKFNEKSLVLNYNDAYQRRTVVVRMPIDEKTTVEEVESYFAKFAESLKEQKQEKEIDRDEK